MAFDRNLLQMPIGLSAPPSRTRPARTVRIRACMERYISPILVTSVLDRALAHRGAGDGPLSPEKLREIVEESMLGLRLFVPEARLPELMIELAEILDEED